MGRFARASSLVTAVASGEGCYKNLPFNNYRLRLPEGVTVGEVRVGGRAVLKLLDLSIKVDAISHLDSAPAVVDVGGVLLILVFAPNTLEYTFDPTKVLVHLADGSIREPTWYIGPGRLRRLYRDDRGCLPPTVGPTRGQEWLHKSAAKLPQLERFTTPARYPLALDATCFVLQYHASIVAPTSAQIEFGGVARNGRDVPAPTLLLASHLMYGRVLDVRNPTR